MSEKRKHFRIKNVKTDKNGNYILEFYDREDISLSEEEVNTLKYYYHQLTKHSLRFDIWNILEIFYELNITQISNLVEQSKSTVARHLKLMEEDGIIVSRTSDKVQKGKIPPKLYLINHKLYSLVKYLGISISQVFGFDILKPKDPKELISFYKGEIQMYRFIIYRNEKMLTFLNPLLDHFEEQLGNLAKAKKYFQKYFTGKLEPYFVSFYVSEKYYEKLNDLYFDFLGKATEVLKEQDGDPEVKERAYVYFNGLLSMKTLFEIYQEDKKSKK